MAKSSQENVVKTTIIAADGTAPGAKAAKDTIQKTVGGLKPVEVKAQVDKSSMSEMRSKISGHFGQMFSAVAIGTLIADGIKFAFKTAMEEVFKSVELWDVFESSAKRAFAGAQAQGFRGDFDQFAASQLKNINAISMVYGVQQTQLENAAALLSRVFKPDQVQNMMAGLAKLQMVTGKSAEDWASLIVKVNGGAFQAKKLVEMGIQVPKGFTGEEQGEVVVKLLNDYIKKMTSQDTSFLTDDMPIDQINAIVDGIRLSIGQALDKPITNVVTEFRNIIIGTFGSFENFGKYIGDGVVEIVKMASNIFGVFRIISNIITIGLRLIVGAIGMIAAPIGGLVAKLTGQGTYKDYVSGFWKSWREGMAGDFSDIAAGYGALGFDPTQKMHNPAADRGAQIYKNMQAQVDYKASNMRGVSYNKSVFAKEQAKEDAKDAKEQSKASQAKVIIQMPYGMRPAFANGYAPTNSIPMRRY